MKPTEMLKEIKNLLGIELSAEVEEVKVEASEEVQAEAEVAEATEETKVEFAQMTLENGAVIEAEEFAPEAEVFIVTEEDRIALPVGEYELEDGQILIVVDEGIISEIKAPEAEVEVEVEAAEEEMGYVKKEEFAAAVEEIKAMIDELKAGMKEKEEMAAEAAEVEAQVKEELSATPAAAPLKHNPEAQAQKEAFTFATKRRESTRDRVLSKISNFK
jgi:hypothetical protein